MSMDEQDPATELAVEEQGAAPAVEVPTDAQSSESESPEVQAGAGHELEYDTAYEFSQVTGAAEPGDPAVTAAAAAAAIASIPSPGDPAGQLASASALSHVHRYVLELEGRIAELEAKLEHVLARLVRHGIVLS